MEKEGGGVCAAGSTRGSLDHTHTDTHHRACFSFRPENRKRFSLVRFQPFTIDSLLMFHATTALTAGHVYLVAALWPLLTEKTWV